MYEDAGCNNPCGGEPMMCGNCPELRGQTYEYDPADYDYEQDYDQDYTPPECTECGEYLEVYDEHYYSCPMCGHQPLR